MSKFKLQYTEYVRNTYFPTVEADTLLEAQRLAIPIIMGSKPHQSRVTDSFFEEVE